MSSVCILGKAPSQYHGSEIYISLSASGKMASWLEVSLKVSSALRGGRCAHVLYVIINPYWNDGLNNTRQTCLKEEHSIDLIKISNGITLKNFNLVTIKKKVVGRSILLIWKALHDTLSDKIKLQTIMGSGEIHAKLLSGNLWEIENGGRF